MKNYYKILQIDISAEQEIIEAAYRRLMKKYHPDVVEKSERSFPIDDDKVKDIIEAYEVLREETKRRDYDNAFRNARRESQQMPFDDQDPNIINKTILFKCSVSARMYKMHLAKSSNGPGPYIVKSFELLPDEEQRAAPRERGRWSPRQILENIGNFTKVQTLIKRTPIEEEDLYLGDIEWAGVKCPDCGKSVQIKPGVFSTFSVCGKCHGLKCMGNAIRGVAGYYTLCPWCGKNALVTQVVKAGSKSGFKITGIVEGTKNRTIPLLPGIKLLKK